MKKRLLALGLILCLAAGLMPGCTPTGLTIQDGKGNTLLRAAQPVQLEEDARSAYLDLVLREAEQVLMTQTGCTAEKARARLFSGCTVYTYFDQQVFEALQTAASTCGPTLPLCFAVTDLQGGLAAVYSGGTNGNLAVYRTPPCSAFKPLSVYAPALEAGVIQYTTRVEDSPYKQLTDSDGVVSDWPANATNTYSYRQESIARGIQQSLNTVAVKCLDKLTVEASMDFLKKQLGLSLEAETYVLENLGSQEIIGNIALGILEQGVTPVEMAGWYQMFAGSGSYTPPKTISKICGSDGAVLYTRQTEAKQVLSPHTAEQMNILLQGVVDRAGTGGQANCADIAVAGKTGTNDDYSGNWFVGVTPSYSCAVWHGKADDNRAAGLFATAIQSLYMAKPELPRAFPEFTHVRQVLYCTQSGLAVGEGCSMIEMGYLPAEETLNKCTMHLK